MAPPKSGKTTPPIPHVSVKNEVPEPVKESPDGAAKPGGKRKLILIAGGLAALLLIGGGGFYAYKTFLSAPPAPPPPVAKKAATPPATATKTPGGIPPSPGGPTAPVVTTTQSAPSDALNQIAHAPSNAINKARDAVTARDASGQTRVSPEDLGDKPAAPAGSAKTPTAMTSIGKGVSASMPVDAAVEATAEFRSFVANAKISGVFQGTPSRAFINGRLARAGDTVEQNLGIIFASVDTERRQLVFKDKAGAIVSRKY